MKFKKRLLFPVLILALYIVFKIQIPYYIERPGSAIPLAPMVEVAEGFQNEKGSLHMTTVRLAPASVGVYLYSLADRNAEIIPAEAVHNSTETNEQYAKRQLEVMRTSQDSAKIVAFQRAGYQFPIQNNGVVVMQLLPGLAAEQKLAIGDIIVGIDGHTITTATELVDLLKERVAGDKVKVTYLRNEQREDAVLELKTLPGATNNKAGIGIASPMTHREFTLPKAVTFKTEDIGGPSAGLMFTLEMVNQLKEEDITKGYSIAGTGTINEDGTVGAIGGIKHKVVAAYESGAEIFFAPAMKIENANSNYEDALEKVKATGLNIKVVPVNTVDDALEFLKTLTPKT